MTLDDEIRLYLEFWDLARTPPDPWDALWQEYVAWKHLTAKLEARRSLRERIGDYGR